MLEPPVSRPAASYADAVSRAHDLMALDDERIFAGAKTVLLDHRARQPWAVVLLHGLTNHPGQYAQFAPQVFERGANVLVPRMPKHGYADRMTTALATLTAEELLATTNEAIDIACGLGERVAVMGISLGGLLSAYFGQFGTGVATAVPIAPDFGLLQLPYGATRALARLLLLLPNLFLWWDPRIRTAQRPKTAYPRFATRALMQTLRIGDAIYRAAKTEAANAARIATVVNRADPAVNNEVTREVVNEWKSLRRDGIDYLEWNNLPENHDIIDPDNPRACTDIVYPRLLNVLFPA
jgi:alpha-beta hydrolase superfamily lysophospholipase